MKKLGTKAMTAALGLMVVGGTLVGTMQSTEAAAQASPGLVHAQRVMEEIHSGSNTSDEEHDRDNRQGKHNNREHRDEANHRSERDHRNEGNHRDERNHEAHRPDFEDREHRGNHPDFEIIEPDGKSIKIDQIRSLQQDMANKPIISKNKIYLNQKNYSNLILISLIKHIILKKMIYLFIMKNSS